MSNPPASPPSPPTAAAPPRSLRLDVILLVCSLFYIVAEFVFNTRLLDTASDIQASSDDLHSVEYFGRFVSGVGLSLLVAGFFARDGFRMSRLSDQILFGVLAVVCPLVFLLSPLSPQNGGLDPAGVSFTQLITASGPAVNMDFPPPDASMLWIMLPFIGIFTVLVAHYKQLPRIAVVAGLFMMTWPAMFFGQKIMIERFMVHPTTWETRLDARYMQMMRAGFGHGIIALRDLRFDQGEDPALRTFLVLMGSLFMQFPEEAKEMIREKEEDIVQLVVMRSDIQDIDARYQEYQAEADTFRAEYYEPYQNASGRYQEALSGPYLQQARDQALAMAKKSIDDGWMKMRDALGTCRAFAAKNATTILTNLLTYNRGFVACTTEACRNRTAINYRRMVRNTLDFRVPYDYWCESSGVDPQKIDSFSMLDNTLREIAKRETFACKPESMERVIERIMPFCTQEIQRQKNFSAAIRTREDFENSPVLHKQVRSALINTLRREHKLMAFTLPEGWHISDVSTLDDALARAIALRADTEWVSNRRGRDNDELDASAGSIGGNVPRGIKPGLDFDAFVATPLIQNQLQTALADMYYPGFSLSLTREDFIKNIVVPDIKRRAARHIHEMEEEGKQFANGEKLERQGKEAIRFIYIPSIALFISLFLVVLTLARCLITALRLVWRRFNPDAAPSPRRLAAAWVVVAAAIAGFPYIAGSRTAQSESYQQFLQHSFERAPVTSALIDWTMRAEPIIYSAGKSILQASGLARESGPRSASEIAPVIVFDRKYDAMLRQVQEKLAAEKILDPSFVGGVMNNATHEAILSYQRRFQLSPTGLPDAETLKHMQIAPAPAAVPEQDPVPAPDLDTQEEE